MYDLRARVDCRLLVHEEDLPLIVDKESGNVDFGILRPMPGDLEVGTVHPEVVAFALAVHRGENVTLFDQPGWMRGKLEYDVPSTGEHIDIRRPTIGDYGKYGEMLERNVLEHDAPTWWHWAKSDFGWGTEGNAEECHVEQRQDGYRLVSFRTPGKPLGPSFLFELEQTAKHLIRFESSLDEEEPPTVRDADGEVVPDEEVQLFELNYYTMSDNFPIGEEEYCEGEDCYAVWE